MPTPPFNREKDLPDPAWFEQVFNLGNTRSMT